MAPRAATVTRPKPTATPSGRARHTTTSATLNPRSTPSLPIDSSAASQGARRVQLSRSVCTKSHHDAPPALAPPRKLSACSPCPASHPIIAISATPTPNDPHHAVNRGNPLRSSAPPAHASEASETLSTSLTFLEYGDRRHYAPRALRPDPNSEAVPRVARGVRPRRGGSWSVPRFGYAAQCPNLGGAKGHACVPGPPAEAAPPGRLGAPLTPDPGPGSPRPGRWSTQPRPTCFMSCAARGGVRRRR